MGDVDVEDDPGDFNDDEADGLAAEPVPVLELPEGKGSRSGLVRLCGHRHRGAGCPPTPLTM